MTFRLEYCCGEQKSVRWLLFCPQTLIFTIENGGRPVPQAMRAGATKVPCGPLKEVKKTETEDTGPP